jgi:phytoene dehydrogenase-like protein
MKTAVVGAGGGGVASALLARLRGEEVTLFESHESIGGCASWFDRRNFSFDVGATTLSGLSYGGPLWDFFHRLGEFPSVRQIDPGITFHLSSGKVIHYYASKEKWLRELEVKFPHLNHRVFWDLVYSLDARAWGLLDNLSAFPFRSIQEFSQVLKAPQYFHLFGHLLVTTEMMLKRYQLDDPSYLEMVNGILIISAQAEAREVPFLIGAMALAYPAATFAPVGGMKGLMNFFKGQCDHHGVRLLENTRVEGLKNKVLTTTKGTDEFDRVILNLTRWDMPALFAGKEREKIEKDIPQGPVGWGAFTVYFGCPTQVENLYQQVHLNHPVVKNYFISFSSPGDDSGDHQRAPQGWQAVTISTHYEASQWFGLEKEEYREQKLKIQNLILDDFKQRFGIEEFKYLTAGTPKTFHRYTGRTLGQVGGVPLLYGMNPWKILDHRTALSHVFRVGDTTFPGQGLVGVVAGAMALDRELSSAP